jgi:patatin-like phospholipase domain-containing protein 2
MFSNNSKHSDETALDNVEDYDPECKECVDAKKNAMRGDMPETVVSVFQAYIEMANKGLMNWVFRHRSAKLLKALPATALSLPADIFCATLTK